MSLGHFLRKRNAVLLVAAVLFWMLFVAGCASDEDRVATFIERGEAYVENDQPEEAIIEFKNVLQIEPENLVAHEALSLVYLKVKKPREAYWEMSETVRLDPQNVDARLRYGTVSAAIRDFDLSLEQADAILQIDPANAAAFVLRAQSWEAKEDFEAAERDLRAAVEADPEGPAYRYLLSSYYERRGDREQSEQVLRELIEIEESYIAVAALSRMLLRARDRNDEALVALKRSVELAAAAPAPDEEAKVLPKEGIERTSLVSNVPREDAIRASYVLLASFYYDLDQFDRTIEVLEEAIGLSETKIELIYQMASFYRLKGMLDKQDELIRRATRESPDSVSAQLVLSAYLGREGDLEGALAAARDAVAIDPEHRAAQLREAELLVDLGYQNSNDEEIQAGRAIVDKVLQEEPDSPEANFVRAKVEISEGDIGAAKESLEAVLQARPDWAQARFVLGSALAASGELSRARIELARAIEIDPQMSNARKLLVKVHAQLGEHEFAIELGREYLEKNPDDIEVRIVVGQSLIRIGRGEDAYAEVEKIPEEARGAAALFALGRLDIAFGRIEQGTERLRRADELSPGNPPVIRTLMKLDRAKGSMEASAARIARAIEASPDDSEIIEIAAEIKLAMGDNAGARAALERAVELEPRNVTAQITLAELERREGNLAGMAAVLERAAVAVPESSDLQYRLAQVYERNGQRGKAIDAYEKSISLNADLAIAKNNLAYLLAKSGGDLDRALELAQQAKEQLPDDANSADTLGWVLLKRGVPSAAIGYLEEAAERFPADAAEVQGIVRNHLAEAYEKNSEASKAVSESKKSVDYYDRLAKVAKERGIQFPEPDWAQEARERIARLESAS